MSEWLKSWVMGLTGTGILAAVALAVTPEGTIKKITRMGVGLVLLVMTVKPLTDLRGIELTWDSGLTAQAAVEAGQTISQDLQVQLIHERLSAYIFAKGESLGLTLEVTPELTEIDGVLTVTGVELVCLKNDTVTAIEEMTRWLTDNCGIAPSQQHWRRG